MSAASTVGKGIGVFVFSMLMLAQCADDFDVRVTPQQSEREVFNQIVKEGTPAARADAYATMGCAAFNNWNEQLRQAAPATSVAASSGAWHEKFTEAAQEDARYAALPEAASSFDAALAAGDKTAGVAALTVITDRCANLWPR